MVVLSGFAVVLCLVGASIVLKKALVSEAQSRGMDWAHYVETGLRESAKQRGSVGDDPALRHLLRGLFSVGNILQIDYLDPDCSYCKTSFIASDFQDEHDHETHGEDNHDAHGHDDHDDHAAMFPPKKLNWSVYPVNRELVTYFARQNAHEIHVHQESSTKGLGTFAEVFHPVQNNGQTDYVVRVIVDLEDQYILFRELLATGLCVSLLVILIVVGIPTRKLLLSMERQRLADKEAAFFANHDVLTSLPNRNNFQESAEDVIWKCRETNQSIALYLFDLNDFKDVNDFYGHEVGDKLLCVFADLLLQHTPENGLIARLGGDEFVALIPGVEPEETPLCDLLVLPTEAETSLPISGSNVRAGISGGVALYPNDGEILADLMQSADLAVYSAKSTGGGICAFEPHMKEAFLNRLKRVNDFRDALEEGQIVPFYQAIVDTERGVVAGLEALARWDHPEKGILSPGYFEEALKDNQICASLGKSMLKAVTADMAEWSRRHVDFRKVGINITMGDLVREDFTDDVLAHLHAAGVAPSALTLEVTENCLFEDEDSGFIGHLNRLKAAGCGVALDDFGTGYSSITRLKDVPFDVVKIDKSFIDYIDTDERDAAIVGALSELGRIMSYDVVAEGVETESQAAHLSKIACTKVQGYLYSKAVPSRDVPQMIANLERKRLAG